MFQSEPAQASDKVCYTRIPNILTYLASSNLNCLLERDQRRNMIAWIITLHWTITKISSKYKSTIIYLNFSPL